MSGYVVVVELDVEATAVADFMVLLRDNAAASLREETGCRRFDVCVDPAAAGTILLYEIYDDAAAFDAHLRSAHYLSFDRASAAMIRSKTVRRLLLDA